MLLLTKSRNLQTRANSKPDAAVVMAALPELLIAAAVIVVFGVTWLSCIAEQKGRHTLLVVLTWQHACLQRFPRYGGPRSEASPLPSAWSVDDPDMKLGQDCYIVRDANGG